MSPLSFVPIFVLGGAYRRADSDASAFGGSRDIRYVVNISATTPSPDDFEAERAWVRDYWSALVPHAVGVGSYVNFMTDVRGRPRPQRVRREVRPPPADQGRRTTPATCSTSTPTSSPQAELDAAMTGPPIDPPDTDLARQAKQLLHAECDPHVAAHCERSFQFAALLARAEEVDLDLEVLYIGTVLHDVGLSARFRGPERFEMRGANAVRAILRQAGMAEARAESVWDVIALHASTAIATHKSVETRIANRGISVDVRGEGASGLPEDAVRAVLDAWPRHDFPPKFSRTMVDEVRANPAVARSSWMEGIAVAHVPGFQPADFLATLHASDRFV